MESTPAPASGPSGGGAFAATLNRRRIRAGEATQAQKRVPTIARYEWLAIMVPVLNILLSPSLLWLMGIPYASEGGNPLFKLHPGTYCAFFAFVGFLMRNGRPREELSACYRRMPVVMWYLAMIGLCAVTSLITHGVSGSAIYIETYVPVGLLLLIFGSSTDATKRKLGYIIFGLFVANVLIATVENVVQKPMIPMYVLGELMKPVAGEFRGKALYDHPLTGATFTMLAAIMMWGIDLKQSTRALLLGVFAVGLLGFGGRTAMGITIATFAIWTAIRMVRGSINGTVNRYEVAAVLFAAIALPVLVAIVATQTTIGERMLARLYWDDSAQTRIVQFRVLADLTPKDWILGASIDRVRDIIFQLGLKMPFTDIENFWLVMLINLGAIGYVFYLAGFLPLLAYLWRSNTTVAKVMLFTMILVASTSNSLGRKCNVLTIAVPAMIATSAFERRRPYPMSMATSNRPAPILRPRPAAGAFAGRMEARQALNQGTPSTGLRPANGA